MLNGLALLAVTSTPYIGDYLREITGAMIDDIYNSRLLELAGNIAPNGRLPAPHGAARAHSKLCGSTVEVELCLQDGVVSDYAHQVRACALGQASASVMARAIRGCTADELRAVKAQMTAMLKENGPPPGGRFADLRFLEPVRDYKARHASTLLVFDAVCQALDAAGATEAAA